LWLLAAGSAVGCGQQAADGPSAVAPGDPGPVHVHGLGVNPADESLFIATHTGLFRAESAELRARRVGDRYQDTMGFTVIGPDHFLGSGHPDGREQLPPFLGLIESRDAGRTWRAVSLQRKVDFHVLEARGRRIYGYGSDWESRQPRFLTSSDGVRSVRSAASRRRLIAALGVSCSSLCTMARSNGRPMRGAAGACARGPEPQAAAGRRAGALV
jgi:hypothetical protein